MAFTYTQTAAYRAGSGGDPYAFNHTPGSDPSAVMVITVNNDSYDEVIDVTYGGIALVQVASYWRDLGELGDVSVWFRGLATFPTGTQSVSLNMIDNNPSQFEIVCLTFPGPERYIYRNSKGDEGELTDPTVSQTLSNDSLTRQTMGFGGIFSGHDSLASVTLGGELTQLTSRDFGNQVCRTFRMTNSSSANLSASVTAALEDCVINLSGIEVLGAARLSGGAAYKTLRVGATTTANLKKINGAWF